MAIHANSIPASERTLLRGVVAPGRLLPTTLPTKLGLETEFLLLMNLKRQTEARLDAIVDMLDPDGAPHQPVSEIQGAAPCDILADGARPLPRSGLKQVAAGVLLFKATGGQHAR